MKNPQPLTNKCYYPRTEAVLLSMIMLVLTLSMYRYADFVTSFQNVTFANKSMVADMVLPASSNATRISLEKRPQVDSNKSEVTKTSNTSYLIPNKSEVTKASNMSYLIPNKSEVTKTSNNELPYS